jgi:hypothetical protein
LHPELWIIIGESGFGQRPTKDSVRNCVVRQDSWNSTPPRFLEKSDGRHLSIVAVITLSGKSLTLLLSSSNANLHAQLKGSQLLSTFKSFQTNKYYPTQKAWHFYLNKILVPDFEEVHVIDPGSKCVVAYDVLKVHRTDWASQLCERGTVVFATSPAYSSHLTQQLDVGIFGGLKT